MSGEFDFTPTEYEVIALYSAVNLIDEIVNHVLIKVVGEFGQQNVIFEDHIKQRYFNIHLVDFVSEKKSLLRTGKESCLSALLKICDKPSFDESGSVNSLRKSVEILSEWLIEEVLFQDVWFPSLDIQSDIEITRMDIVCRCGNISKHNLTNLTGVAKHIRNTFNESGHQISISEGVLAIDDFFEWFNDNILSFHMSYLAQMLNDIRWGLHNYLLPHFSDSIEYFQDNGLEAYRYTFPDEVKNDLTKNIYWQLMNSVRGRPYLNIFKVNNYYKTYSL